MAKRRRSYSFALSTSKDQNVDIKVCVKSNGNELKKMKIHKRTETWALTLFCEWTQECYV